MLNYKEIISVDLEVSTLCNASCPDCPRNLRGYDIEDPSYILSSLTLDQVKTLIPVDFIKQLTNFNLVGNHGDFITCKDGLKIIQYLYDTNPNMSIFISTNASGQPKIWSELGKIPTLSIGFRLDGLRDTQSIYRQYTEFDLIIDNAKNFIQAGGNAIWKMILFDFNSHQVEIAKKLSQELGFSEFHLIDQSRNKMPVFTRQGTFVRNIGNPEHHNTIEDLIGFRKHIIDNHVDFHQSIKQAAISKDIDCISKKNKSIYIQVNGQVYPCCWLAFFPDINLERTGNDQIKQLSVGNNAFEVGLENAVGWFSELEKTWNIPTVSQGRSYICNETCGRCN